MTDLIKRIGRDKGSQDDLKQELFLILCEADEALILALYSEKRFYFFCAKVIVNMTSKTGKFYKTYLNTQDQQKSEYARLLSNEFLPDFDLSHLAPAVEILKKKEAGTPEQCHEAIIFGQYIEQKDGRQVADFFGIPYDHVKKVIRNTRRQLKNAVKNGISS
jgi:hypothetical protein